MNRGLTRYASRVVVPVVLGVAIAVGAVACGNAPLNDGPPTVGPGTPVAVPGGNITDGEMAILTYDCGSCHTIPGVMGANSGAAPTLAGFASRKYVIGALPNQPANLILWLKNPQSVIAQAPMPNLGLTDQDARNIAAYLYKLY